jgi:hypothetical protein
VCGLEGDNLKFYFLEAEANGLWGLGRGSGMALPSSASRAFLAAILVAAGPLAANCNRITTNINPIISLMYYFFRFSLLLGHSGANHRGSWKHSTNI